MKKIVLLFILITNIYANSNSIYTNNCVKCHSNIPVSIDKFFFRYLLKYSSEKNLKNAMFEYLKKPNKESTVMPEAFIKRFGLKKQTSLDDKALKEALDTYWNKYKVFGKLK
ncbi:MAG: hypothetical protein ACQERD_03725 [Campylobacterota bacterium]